MQTGLRNGTNDHSLSHCWRGTLKEKHPSTWEHWPLNQLRKEQECPFALSAHPSPQSELAVKGDTDSGAVDAFEGRKGVSVMEQIFIRARLAPQGQAGPLSSKSIKDLEKLKQAEGVSDFTFLL